MRVILCSIVIGLLLSICHAEIFTALATMKRALYIEKKLAENLRAYIDLIPDKARSQRVAELADEYDQHATEALVDAESYLANPVNAYRLCKKFTTEIPAVKELLQAAPLVTAFEAQLSMYRSEMPDQEDFGGVVDSMLRLMDTYQIPPSKFVDGTFSPVGNSPTMTASDCFEIGRYAYEKGDKYHALMWLLESLASHELEGEVHSMNLILLLDYLTYAADDQGNPRHALNYAWRLLSLDPPNPRTKQRMNDVIAWLTKEIQADNLEYKKQGRRIPSQDSLPPIINKRTTLRTTTQEFKNYESLCRGEDTVANPYEATLKCYYSTMNENPILVLAPVKVEELFHDPDLVQFHDVVSDNEISLIKNLSTPILKRAVVNDPKTGKLVTAVYRVSRSAWLYDEHHPSIRTITNRIAAITNLNMETVEPLQVVNYGIGGQYEPHFDMSRDDQPNAIYPEWMGNRIATLIFYLSDVPAGGLTVFTEVGAKVQPIKGTAAFWWNLKKNGYADYNTRHAGCPVLAGSKWVANKWMHIRGQEWRRPCGLTTDAK